MSQILYNYMKNSEIYPEQLEELESNDLVMSQISNTRDYCDGLFTALEFYNDVGFEWLYRTLNDLDLDFRDCNKNDKTILMRSTENDAIFKFLCRNMPNQELVDELNKQNSEGDSAMHYLFRNFSDNDYIIQNILPLHPDISKKNMYEENPFSTLVLTACIDEDMKNYENLIAEILKQDQSVLFIKDSYGNIPIFITVINDSLEIFNEMLEYTEDKSESLLHQNNDGYTILHIALKEKVDTEIIDSILTVAEEYGILQELLFIENKDGETAMFLYQSGDFEVDYRETLDFLFQQFQIEKDDDIKQTSIDQKISEMLKYTQSKWNNSEKYWEKSKAFKNSKGNSGESIGVLYSVVDLEDVENKKYLEEDPGNLIFMLQNTQDKSYNAFGYNIQGVMSSPNNELFFECKLQGNTRKSQYDYNSQNKYFSFSLQDPVFLKISFPVESGQINKYILLENVIGALKSQERVFLIEKTEKTLEYSVAYHVAKGYLQNTEHNIVSADHCQEGTDKLVSDIYVCYDC